MIKTRRQFYQSVNITVEDGKASNTQAKTTATITVRSESAKKLKAVSSIRKRSGQGQPADNGNIPKERDSASDSKDKHAGRIAEK